MEEIKRDLMGSFYLVFSFILLICLKQTEADKCKEKCGDVYIPQPFGITSGCYNNSWFRVSCNKTADGLKPFISRINLELIGSIPVAEGGNVIVNNPVTYLNCFNNGTAAAASIVNLKGSPFFFSSKENVFGSVGCGNFVTVSPSIRTDPIGGCLQPRCGNLDSELGGCYAIISENLSSYTAILTEINNIMKKHYSKRCTSAFIFNVDRLISSGPDLEIPHDISIDTTHVPAVLQWYPVDCDLKGAGCHIEAKTTGVVADNKSVCNERCGNVDITFPFGIKYGCYMNEWFRVTCNKTKDGAKPFISSINMQLLNVSFPQGRVIVNNSIIYSNCISKDEDHGQDNNGVSADLRGSPFYFSHIFNRFMTVGCGNLATIFPIPNPTGYPIVGCLQTNCGNISPSDISCIAKIPAGLSSFVANMTQIYPSNGTMRSCRSAFLIDISNLMVPDRKIVPGSSFLSWPLVPPATPRKVTLQVGSSMPTSLQWGIPIAGVCGLKNGSTSPLCSSDGQYCWTRLSTTHLCVCTSYSNPLMDYYFTDVCKAIGKCEESSYRYCGMLCLNAPGNYCSSPCPNGYEYSSMEDTCRPINTSPRDQVPNQPPTSPTNTMGIGPDLPLPPIRPIDQVSDNPSIPPLPRYPRSWNLSRNLPIIIGCSTSIGTVFLLLGAWRMHKVLRRRKNIKLKQKYFKKNGGLLLQQQLRCNEGNVVKIKLFGSKELAKATDYYNQNRILGQGGQGTVYKGMLTDGSIVAIKKSIIVEDKILDENKLNQFINEVIILSQINHRNVVKLLGCCLETEVPLLVYEFVPNGTLYELIHDQNEEFPLTWEMRFRIAIEIANALSYLHSAASAPIYHRDIKSSNILLDDKYRAKVSDFGTSKSVALEQTHLTTRVQGTFGYMDPEYFRLSRFTDKSDVYSFGVVLVELLTGQKPISTRESEEEAISLVNFFLSSMKENALFDTLDPMVYNNGPEEDIIAAAKLAKRCLNLNGKKRPTMKQVSMELESIRAPEEGNHAVQQSADEDSDIDEVIEIEPSATSSCSTSRSIIIDSVSLPILDEQS